MDVLENLFGVKLKTQQTGPTKSLVVYATESIDRRHGPNTRVVQVTAAITIGSRHQTISFNTDSQKFGRELADLISNLPFKCTLQESEYIRTEKSIIL